VEIVGIHVDNLDFSEAAQRTEAFLEGSSLNMIFTPNSEILVDAVKDPKLGDILNHGQLVIPDGIGVVIASRFYRKPLKEKVAGVDLMSKMLEQTAARGGRVYLLGATQESVEAAAANIKERYEPISIAGIRDGYFSEEEEEDIIEEINNSKADLLLVGLGAPKQEKFIYRHKDQLQVKIAIGIGGSIDILSGRKKRAPEFYQKAGLEWLYTLLMQPKRIFRVMKLPKFVLLALYDALTSKY
jgi:N-acetylglucosaminyldiphosphoundecaprenol N-acetyl-beta-D-mannosaminyltransferase